MPGVNTNILVVEDELIVAKDIQQTLTSLGYTVPGIASSGEEALQKTEEFKPDLVLMDIKLKGDKDGIETAHEIKSKFDLPVVYLTAHADDETLQRAKVTEPFGYLVKPFEERELYSTIEMALYKRKMEVRLKESEKKYRLLFENLNVGIYRVTPGKEGKFTDVNSAFVKILGYPHKNEILKMKVAEIYANPENRIEFADKISSAGFVRNEELHLKKKDGTPIIASDTGIAVYDEEGEIIFFDGILEDITERRRMEEELRSSEERYRALVNNYPEPMVVFSEGIIVYVNPATVELIGAISSAELIGKSVFDFIHPGNRNYVKGKVHEIETGGELDKHTRIKLIRLDGETIDVEATSIFITYKSKPAVQSMLTDITDTRRMEEVLRESVDRFRSLVEGVVDGIIIIQDEKVKYVNPGIEKIFGYNVEEIVDKPFLEFIHPDERVKVLERYKQRMIGEVVPTTYQSVIIKNDGSAVDVEINATIISYENKPADLVVLRNITDRKKIEDAIRQSEEKYRVLVDTIPQGLMVTDLNGKIVMVNKQALEMCGCNNDSELIGKYSSELVSPDDRDRARGIIQQVMETGAVMDNQYSFMRKDGTTYKGEVNSATIFDKDKNPKNIIHLFREIPDRVNG